MTQTLLLLLAVILIGIRLPAVMRQLEVRGVQKIGFVMVIFGILGLAWLAVRALAVVL